MNQWIVAALVLIAGAFIVPMQMRSIGRWRKGRGGGVMASFAEGVATALDPGKALIVAEMEKRQNQDGEEADGDDEPLGDAGAPSRSACPKLRSKPRIASPPPPV